MAAALAWTFGRPALLMRAQLGLANAFRVLPFPL